jgi:hypothetical protein
VKRHFTFSFDTVCALIGVLVVARVLARSWLWVGHGLPAQSGGGLPADEEWACGPDELPDAPPPPQPARMTAASRTPARARASLTGVAIELVNDIS